MKASECLEASEKSQPEGRGKMPLCSALSNSVDCRRIEGLAALSMKIKLALKGTMIESKNTRTI